MSGAAINRSMASKRVLTFAFINRCTFFHVSLEPSMPIFYRGAGVGTYWHQNDARRQGFTPRFAEMLPGHNRLLQHIARATTYSPYVSLTRSYSIAWGYAVYAGRVYPSENQPAFVYEIEIDEPLPHGVILLDPLKEIAGALNGPLASISYQHDGHTDFIRGVADPVGMAQSLRRVCVQPPGSTGAPRPANLTLELETLIRAMRDAEILSLGAIPAAAVRIRWEVRED